MENNGLIDVLRKTSKGLVSEKIQYTHRNFCFATLSEIRNLNVGDECIFDVECYSNLLYIGFYFPRLNKVFGLTYEESIPLDCNTLYFILWKFKIIGFNINGYDIPILTYALTGKSLDDIKFASDTIIQQNVRAYQFAEMFNCEIPKYNAIDLMEVCPLDGSLKTYAARLNCERMQDLPIAEDVVLNGSEIELIKNYCINDLANTYLIYRNLTSQIKLREKMSVRYSTDLRSKSDAQIAESVICREIKNITGEWPKKVKSPPAYVKYVAPPNIQFKTPHLQEWLRRVQTAEFPISSSGNPLLPTMLKGCDLNWTGGDVIETTTYKKIHAAKPEKWQAATITINGKSYRTGMGGLHSCETNISYYSDDETEIADNDVESYYPRIIINNKYEPASLKGVFLPVYVEIVDERLAAKAAKDKDTADSLKIVINGSFGKYGSIYSGLYAPDLLLQVTICGQLFLLMLIEYLELNGIEVISANTDGIVLKYHKSKRDLVRKYIKEWEEYTNFKTEETLYKSIHIKDVNNYIAVKPDNKCKFKGEYANPWTESPGEVSIFHKNPENRVCIEAVKDYILTGRPLQEHILNEQDVMKFVCVGNVKGGGHKNGVYLGKVVRWYYKEGEKKGIYYSGSGNQVQSTIGAWPMMDAVNKIPDDLDYSFYVKRSTDILYHLGILTKKQIKSLSL